MAARRGRSPASRSVDGREKSAARRRQRSPLTLDSVIDAARQLLASEGLEALSLRGVAARMGVTAPALYAHVDDKLDLMRKIGEDGFESLIRGFAPISSADPLEEIRQIARVYLRFARSNPQQFRVMFLFPAPVVGAPAPDSLLKSARAYAIATDAVSRAIEAGALRPEDPQLAMLTIWSAVHGVTMMLVSGGNFGRAVEDRLMESVVDNLLRGLAIGG
jgi:AcrR family transcriptional regulator